MQAPVTEIIYDRLNISGATSVYLNGIYGRWLKTGIEY